MPRLRCSQNECKVAGGVGEVAGTTGLEQARSARAENAVENGGNNGRLTNISRCYL